MSNTYPKKVDSSNLREEQRAILSAFFERRNLFSVYLKNNDVQLFTCPGCAFPTLSERGGYEICIICNWEDDDQDDMEADEIWGGPNQDLSLTENRLSIGKQLKDIAEQAGGKINDDPQAVLSIFFNYNSTIHDLIGKVPGDAKINHPIFSQYRQMGQSLLGQLII